MINKNYLNLSENYLFATVANKQAEYQKNHPDKNVIKMSIGDVTRPLCPAVISAMHRAVDEMATFDGFRGYGPYEGYEFVREAIKNYYKQNGVTVGPDEIYVSDGAKSDVGNILDIFSKDNTVLIPDPVYPVYLDTNVMDGRKISFAPATQENGFLPMPEENTSYDIIYICSPNNPTGAVYSKEQLKAWVDYANKNGSVILFDAAYESFVSGDLPRSIFEIDGARTCAIELCSLSKTAGFTGIRCGYTVIPKELERDGQNIGAMWLRRQATKFNGVSYITQAGAAAVFSKEGLKQVRESIDYYKANAEIMTGTMDTLGWWYTGGKNSPYVWVKCPDSKKSWDFFDELLDRVNVVCTPGAGFGACGEGFIRLTAFSTNENTREAMDRIIKAYKK